LRRSFISLLKNKGEPIKIISELVWHSSISQTERVYSVVNKDVQKEELSRLSTSIKLTNIKVEKHGKNLLVLIESVRRYLNYYT